MSNKTKFIEILNDLKIVVNESSEIKTVKIANSTEVSPKPYTYVSMRFSGTKDGSGVDGWIFNVQLHKKEHRKRLMGHENFTEFIEAKECTIFLKPKQDDREAIKKAMKEKKYYTPSIEEFGIGFEYEYETKINGWDKRTFSNDNTGGGEYDSLNEIQQWLFEEKLRVKYLDREDIKSLGFKMGAVDTYIMKPHYNVDAIIIHAFSNGRYVIKERNEAGDGIYQYSAVFRGTIKNKSKLRQILIDTGVIIEPKPEKP